MNKKERKRIAAQVRALQFAQAEGNIMPFSGMREQVLKACQTRLSGQAQADHREKEKSRLRLILRVALVAACLLIGMSVYAVLDPVPVSNANSFLRRAQIWIGNVLKANVAVEPPEKKEGIPDAAPSGRKDFAALKELQKAYGLMVLTPTQLPAGMILGEIKTSGADDYVVKLQYSYQDQNNVLNITVEEVADAAERSMFDGTVEYPASVGTFYVWGTGTGWNASAISGNSSISIKGTMEKEAFFKILDGLRAVQ